MGRERWTLLLVSEKGDGFRQFTFRTKALRLAMGGAGFLSVAILAAIGFAGFHTGRALHEADLARENRILSEELTSIQGRVRELEGDLQFLADRDTEVRTLAGLDRIDEEVLQVGVGGPGTPVLDEHPLIPLNPELGSRVFATAYDVNALLRRAELLTASFREAADSMAVHHDLLESTPSILPTQGGKGFLSSGFSLSRLHPIYHEALPHEGIDVAAPRGTPIVAAANGRVTFVGTRGGYGMMVEIDHGFGYQTVYGHASRLLVTRGQQVRRNDVIALVGDTGLATAPHVHYEVRVGGRPVNPQAFIIAGAIP